jgi:hypothetical protein
MKRRIVFCLVLLIVCSACLSLPMTPSSIPTVTPETISPTWTLPSTEPPTVEATATLRPTPRATATRWPTATRRPTATQRPTSTPPASVGPFLLFSSDGQPASAVLDLRAAPDGIMWIRSHEGWASLYKNKWTLHTGTQDSVLAGFDELGRVWLVSEKGETISAWDGVRWTKYGPEAGWSPAGFPVPPSNERIAIDKHRRVWLVTREDVRAFDGQRWTHYGPEQIGFAHTSEMAEAGFSDSDYWLTDVIADGEGDVWVADCSWMGPGPLGHGARWLADDRWQGQDSRVVATGCIYDIEVDPPGHIWAGVNGDL